MSTVARCYEMLAQKNLEIDVLTNFKNTLEECIVAMESAEFPLRNTIELIEARYHSSKTNLHMDTVPVIECYLVVRRILRDNTACVAAMS